MAAYAATIRRLAPDHDPRHIEAWMRLEYGTLDHLSPQRFAEEVRLATLCIAACPIAESEELAKSYGY